MKCKHIIIAFLFALLPSSCASSLGQGSTNIPIRATTSTPTATERKSPSLSIATNTFPAGTPALTQGISSPLPSSSVVEHLLIVFSDNEALYVKRYGKEPKILASGGIHGRPIISDDGTKIVFIKGRKRDALYSITINGDQEKTIFSTDMLFDLDQGYGDDTQISSVEFIPQTHKLLINTINGGWPAGIPERNHDVFLVDEESATFEQLLARGKGGEFHISPDGRYIGILGNDHIDIIDVFGKFVYPDLVTYPYVHWPTSSIYWPMDSSSLFVLLPVEEGCSIMSEGPMNRTVWKYPMDGNPAAVIEILPPPVGNDCDYTFSDDGNWILYRWYGRYYGEGGSEGFDVGLYVGNMNDGSSKKMDTGCMDYFTWSPDNFHFISGEDHNGFCLGSITEPIKFVDEGEFLGWVDSTYFIYRKGSVFVNAIGEGIEAAIPMLGESWASDIGTDHLSFTLIQ
jgi:hypothetical protein